MRSAGREREVPDQRHRHRVAGRPACRSGTEAAFQSTGTVRVPHWNPSPQSDHATLRSNDGSAGHVVRRRGRRGLRPRRRRDGEGEEDCSQENREEGPPHGQAGSPQGLGRPSFPGFRIPCGSSACLVAASTENPSPRASRTKRARLRPTPWWWLNVAPAARAGADARVPDRPVEVLTLVDRRVTAEGEVQAGAVAVRVRQVRRREQQVVHPAERGRARRRTPRRGPTTAPRSPWCRPRSRRR